MLIFQRLRIALALRARAVKEREMLVFETSPSLELRRRADARNFSLLNLYGGQVMF